MDNSVSVPIFKLIFLVKIQLVTVFFLCFLIQAFPVKPGSALRIRVRIQGVKLNADPDPQLCTDLKSITSRLHALATKTFLVCRVHRTVLFYFCPPFLRS